MQFLRVHVESASPSSAEFFLYINYPNQWLLVQPKIQLVLKYKKYQEALKNKEYYYYYLSKGLFLWTKMPMKSLWIAFTIMLVLSSQLCLVRSRVLRSKVALTKVASDCVKLKGSGSSLWTTKSFVVSNSDNSSTPVSKRSLAFRLASGPSKKGPGHQLTTLNSALPITFFFYFDFDFYNCFFFFSFYMFFLFFFFRRKTSPTDTDMIRV